MEALELVKSLVAAWLIAHRYVQPVAFTETVFLLPRQLSSFAGICYVLNRRVTQEGTGIPAMGKPMFLLP